MISALGSGRDDDVIVVIAVTPRPEHIDRREQVVAKMVFPVPVTIAVPLQS